MLSRVVQASRAARLRPMALPARTAPAIAIPSPWMRSFASSKRPSQNDAKKPSDPKSSIPKESSEQAKPDSEPEPIPFHKLPDLTQGIPSTFEQEMRKQSGSGALEAVEQEYQRHGRDEEYVSTSERNRKWWTRFVLLAAAAGGTFGVLYMGRDWDDAIDVNRHPDIPNGWSPTLWWQRAHARMSESVSYYQDPAFDKLLPDPDPTFERPYTLCLSLDDLLVHSEWSRDHGWRVAKRPGMDYFVRYLSQYYELVLFTTVPFAMGEPIVRKLDPFRFIMWPLYREATKYEEGEIVKVNKAFPYQHIIRC